MSHTRTANSRVLVIVATLIIVSGCGGPTPPSPPRLPPPTITGVEPHTSLTSGGASVKVVGTGFQSATLMIGGVRAGYNPIGDSLIAITPAHSPGLVDITVTNYDGQSATLPGALTYLPIENVDFNGVWEGRALQDDDWKLPLQLTVEHDHLVSFTCGTSGVVVLDPAPSLRDGKFTYTGANGLAINGVIRAPTEVEGEINAPSCEGTYWYAEKK